MANSLYELLSKMIEVDSSTKNKLSGIEKILDNKQDIIIGLDQSLISGLGNEISLETSGLVAGSSIFNYVYSQTSGKADSSNIYTKSEINTKLSTVYTYKGSVSSYADLPLTGLETGWVYNIENADSEHSINPGDNVAWNGSTWDKLAGIEDLSNYVTNDLLSTISAAVAEKTQVDNSGTASGWAPLDSNLKIPNEYLDLTVPITSVIDYTIVDVEPNNVYFVNFSEITGIVLNAVSGIADEYFSSQVIVTLNDDCEIRPGANMEFMNEFEKNKTNYCTVKFFGKTAKLFVDYAGNIILNNGPAKFLITQTGDENADGEYDVN